MGNIQKIYAGKWMKQCGNCKKSFLSTNDNTEEKCSARCALTRKDTITRTRRTSKHYRAKPKSIRSQDIRIGRMGKKRLRTRVIELEKQLEDALKKSGLERNTHPFYDGTAWLTLKYQTLKKYGRTCMFCGRTDGSMHVDHIKPRSKYPEFELDPDNLQILCRDCNLGKSNRDTIDWRPKDLSQFSDNPKKDQADV